MSSHDPTYRRHPARPARPPHWPHWPHARSRFASSCLVAALTTQLPACVALFDVPPGRMYELGPDGQHRDACTDHHAATAADVVLGTLALAGGIFGLALGEHMDGFTEVGLVGIGGAIGHYASAASSDATRCRALRKTPTH